MTHRTPLLYLVPLLASCAWGFERFPDVEPIWVDPDENHLAEEPKEYWSGLIWDGAEQILFNPVSKALSIDVTAPAVNVNAWDEVPNSSWFTNRIGVAPMTPQEVAKGACGDVSLDQGRDGPLTVSAAKPNGANPGFFIEDGKGRRWLMKMDGHIQPLRATVADVAGSRLYHAAGYYAPCNVIVHFDPDQLQIAEDAEVEDDVGKDRPITQADVQAVIDKAAQAPDGRLRASASLFLPGKPLGPWRYQGTRKDDPNDVLRHEDRRELRAGRVLAAWFNHYDAREQNTLSIWAEEDERTFVRHYMIDFGDCFGAIWEANPEELSKRFGFSYYGDIGDAVVDLLTLGAISRPWERIEIDPVVPALRYFEADLFDPKNYMSGYPNPAFTKMQDEDAAWMARIVARFTDAHVAALLEPTELHDRVMHDQLLRTLIGRRDKILDAFLQVRSPLADVTIEGTPEAPTVCWTDLAAQTGVLDAQSVRYTAASYEGPRMRVPTWQSELVGEPQPNHRWCTPLHNEGSYQMIDIAVVPVSGAKPLPPLRLHVVPQAHGLPALRGIERPPHATPPGGIAKPRDRRQAATSN